ncbi:MAG: RNA-protein complex protein Nop10 [Methanomicrobiales archaeon]|nr:RNA-protein complex protein Nop10 [Methanomicrobiales archaeon]MDD1639531.1 RNA-protein complex protein Nop10 [Methanomicrobiales archaeon]MDD1644891.1 RNA-protein complex protein Nop10 [Methanomicrobiales archaeon]MDD1647499.1 RNA-protein complex protein Nop10 [Methanomicrobiales archaeon]MDD1648302.1 RNA-protein complex protein Nop10 [Methanomicrobiales archaeon]
MAGRIRRCPRDQTYTLAPCCPVCGLPTASPHPARFSPHDHHAPFRRMVRRWTR